MKRWAMLAACVALGTAACVEDTGIGSTAGRTQVLLTDSPFPYDEIERVDMYITRIQVANSPDTMTGVQWTTIAEPMQTINLLDLQSGNTMLLGTTELDPIEVGAVRVVVNTSLSSLSRADGSLVPVNWQVNGEMTLHSLVQATLALFAPGTPRRLVIDFDVGRSFVEHNGQLTFIPWIRALDDAGTGTVSGVVTADPDGDGQFTPLARAAVTVLHGSPNTPAYTWYKVATGRTDAQGNYRVAFIMPGEHVIRVEPLGVPTVGCFDSLGVMVGGDITVNVKLPGAPGLCAQETGGGGGPDSTGTPVGGPVESVTLRIGTPSGSTSVQTCDSIPLTAELRDAAGHVLVGRAVSWAQTDSSVMTMDGVFGHFAHLRAMTAGSTTISATSEGKSANVTFTVTGTACTGGGGGGGAVATVSVMPATVTKAPGDSVGLYAGLFNAQNQALSGRPVTWSSSDTTIVSFQGVFGQSVLLNLKKAGSATVTATSEGKSGSSSVTVQ